MEKNINNFNRRTKSVKGTIHPFKNWNLISCINERTLNRQLISNNKSNNPGNIEEII